jgi:DNA-binding phage protein
VEHYIDRWAVCFGSEGCLYKALAPGAKPRFETVMKVAHALGVKFTVQSV